MATISLLFIAIFIMVQSAVGVMLLYRGFALALETFKLESLTSRLMVVGEQLKTAISLAGTFNGWRKTAIIFVLFVPGSIPLLLLVALWRVARRMELGTS